MAYMSVLYGMQRSMKTVHLGHGRLQQSCQKGFILISVPQQTDMFIVVEEEAVLIIKLQIQYGMGCDQQQSFFDWNREFYRLEQYQLSDLRMFP